MDDRRPFGDITNMLYRRKRQLHEESVTHDVDRGIFLCDLFFNKCNYKLSTSWL